MFRTIKKSILNHKFLTVILLLAAGVGSRYYYQTKHDTSQQNRYVLAAVTKGTIITSVTGSGQVSVADQIDVKPKTSGTVLYTTARNDQYVRAGALIAQLDVRDAQRAVRDAEINVQNAQVGLAKLQLNQQQDIPKLQDSSATNQNNLNQAYQNGFNEVANSFLDLPNMITLIRGILYDTTVGTSGQSNFGAYQDLMDRYNVEQLIVMINQAKDDYLTSTSQYNKNLEDYKATSRDATPEQINALLSATLTNVKTMAQSIKDEQNILDTVVQSLKQYQQNRIIPPAIAQYQSDITAAIGKLNSHTTNLTNIQNTITSTKQSLASIQRDVNAAQATQPLDIQSQQILIQQRQAALQDARDTLANYSVRAPFAGIVTKFNTKRGDVVSPGSTIATIVTKQSIAEISLNEVDVAKISIGEKATLTFDAIEGLTITGTVQQIDTLGTVTQGVVTYTVKIAFDTQDNRVKPGMSVSAAIITGTKQDVLLAPNAAIKSGGDTSYVELPDETSTSREQLLADSTAAINGIVLPLAPQRQTIQTGLANDTYTEITSGLKEGDLIIVRTITPTAGTTQSTQNRSLFPIGGGGRNTSGGGAVRGLNGR